MYRLMKPVKLTLNLSVSGFISMYRHHPLKRLLELKPYFMTYELANIGRLSYRDVLYHSGKQCYGGDWID
jgi:hypothetical protein